MRLKEAGLFLLGALVGALLLYYLLWRTDGLAPGHLLARTTADLAGRTERIPPLPTVPFPTAPSSPSPEPSPSLPANLSETPVSLELPAEPTPAGINPSPIFRAKPAARTLVARPKSG